MTEISINLNGVDRHLECGLGVPLLHAKGRPESDRFGPYWIFRSDDAPAQEVFLVETMERTGPFGAKSIGEVPIDAVAPAVRNAVLNATGVAIDELPLTPERVWRALRAAGVAGVAGGPDVGGMAAHRGHSGPAGAPTRAGAPARDAARLAHDQIPLP